MRARCAGTAHDGRGNRIWKGLSIAPEFETFDGFRSWAVAHGFSPVQRSLDRKDDRAGYSLNNCRWVTKADQTRNAVKTRERRRRD